MNIQFRLDSDMLYDLSGTFSDSGGSYITYGVSLYDETTGQFVFANTQQSSGIDPATFTLGHEDGSEHNTLEGFLTGTLYADHLYTFISEGSAEAYGIGDEHREETGSEGTGGTYLALGPVIVPAPSALALAFLAVPLLRTTRRLA